MGSALAWGGELAHNDADSGRNPHDLRETRSPQGRHGMTTPSVVPPAGQKKPQPRLWAPRMWEGCNFLAWVQLLWRGRFAVHWTCWHIVLVVTCVSLWHTVVRLLQAALYGRRIRRTVL